MKQKTEKILVLSIFAIYILGYIFIGKYPFYRYTMFSQKLDHLYFYTVFDENRKVYSFNAIAREYFISKHPELFLNPDFDIYYIFNTKMDKEGLGPIADFIFKKYKNNTLYISRAKSTTSPKGSLSFTPEEQWEFKNDQQN
nr:hypothetical protein BHI3_12390 [Bacteriovorax sp. HI3]